jgi:acetoacetyl-CoA synthetase
MSEPIRAAANVNEIPLWQPSESRKAGSKMAAFAAQLSKKTGEAFPDYTSLHRWSVGNIEEFWRTIWDFCGVVGERGKTILKDGDKMPGAQFFPDSKINYAENLLRRNDDGVAIIFRGEQGNEKIHTFAQLHQEVSRWQQALKAGGVKEGDRVAGFVPNSPDTLIAMLAVTSLGAVWSSASPDFGVQGVIDRFGQIEPKILVCVDGYSYNGKPVDCLQKIREIQPQIKGLERTIVVPFLNASPDISGLDNNTILSGDFLKPYMPQAVSFNRVAFNHPLFIMFSSGTTGVPKCIVHGHGGTLLQHLKEHQLQCDIGQGDRVFYFTTCSWMMWNWLVTALASGATLMLFDGSPFYPSGKALWDFAAQHKCTFFGTSAKYIDALKTGGIKPMDEFDLSSLRAIGSTGSPLVHESFDYIYDSVKKDVHLASFSGGTDIIGCFVGGNPLSPVWRGEIQGAMLGMAVNAYDDDGQPVMSGMGSGELVCMKPFPSMPIGFWNDDDGIKFKSAYFERFGNTWCHGDWIERTAHGGYIISGRSDATLNPQGVRIGTAEIYRQVEKVDGVVESLAVGQKIGGGDERVILFVVLRQGVTLTDDLIAKIKKTVRDGASPRHVPAKIIQAPELPRTRSGKLVEMAVRDVIHGKPVRNQTALANAEALAFFQDLDALKS